METVCVENFPNDGDEYIKNILNKIQLLENRYLELKKEINEIKRRCSKMENPKFIF